MSSLKLTKTRLIGGVWEGELTGIGGDAAPELIVTHLDEVVDGHEVTTDDGRCLVRIPIPVDRIADGIQTFVISDAQTKDTLASFSLMSGDVLSEDIRAEMDLLRAELDMLKRAFRRHCVETSGG